MAWIRPTLFPACLGLCTASCLRPRAGVAFLVLGAAFLPNASALYDDTLDFRNPGSLPDRRTDFCGREEAVHNGSIGIEDALRGLHISVVTTLYDKPWFDEPINNTDPAKMTGFHAKLAGALAARAGFTYTIYSHPLSSFEPDMTWNEYLNASLQKFDVSADWWLATNSRSRMGIQAPHAFLDLSLVSATYAAEVEPRFGEIFWRCADPLAPELWWTFVGLSIVTSLLYFAIEAQAEDGDFDLNKPAYFNALRSIWIGFVQFTGARHFSPQTFLGKFLVLTYSAFVLLLVSSYTANLAAFLMVQHSAQACQSFDACIASGERVCVWQGTAADQWLSNDYYHLEKTGQLVRCDDSPWVCARSQACSLVVQPLTTYELAARSIEHNSGCAMSRVGVGSLQFYGGGWMSKVDYSSLCTSVLIDALKSHMLALQGEGKLDTLLADLYQASMTQPSCSGDQEWDDSKSLPVSAMTGALVLHGSVWCLTFFACCGQWVWARCHRPEEPPQGGSLSDAPAKSGSGEAPAQGIGQANDVEALRAMQKDLQELRAMHANLSLNFGKQEAAAQIQIFGEDLGEAGTHVDDLADFATL